MGGKGAPAGGDLARAGAMDQRESHVAQGRQDLGRIAGTQAPAVLATDVDVVERMCQYVTEQDKLPGARETPTWHAGIER